MTLTVDPAMSDILAVIRSAPVTDWMSLPIDHARQLFDEQQGSWSWCPTPMAEIRELTIASGGRPMRARLYLPSTQPRLPVILFAHGGGWTFGSIDSHDGTMRLLAAHSGMAVLGFDYRLGPEHPYPAPVDDMLAALAFVERGELGPACDPGFIALSGDSAGANIALGTLLTRQSNGMRKPDAAALFYGCYAPVFDTSSNARLGGGEWLLSTERMRWYWSNYLGKTAESHPIAAPLHGQLPGLPPLYLNAAGLDPLLNDTLILSQKLAKAGVRHRLDIWPGVVHGFMRFARELPAAMSAVRAAAGFLQDEHQSRTGANNNSAKP